MYFYCIVPVAPMRSLPAHKSEMVSQLLFGEAVQMRETAPGGWIKVAGEQDGYEGWITQGHITAVGTLQRATYRLTTGYTSTVTVNQQPMHVPLGSCIPDDPLLLNTTRHLWDYSHTAVAEPEKKEQEELIRLAHTYLNTPYLWGGKTVHGIDCSGLVQQVFKWGGLSLPRDAWQQAEGGEALHFLQEAKAGDLAFFDNEEGRIIHVGIMLSDHRILHASGKVRIDAIDTEGIVNGDNGIRTHHLRIVKRLW